jgi:anti-sigma-K factor RskA
MELKKTEQNLVRQYLLGQLSEDQQQEIEKRLMVEDDFFEELETSEGQLADDYVDGNLSETDRHRFDEHYLTTPERQQDVQFARVLKRYVNAHPVQRGPRAHQAWWRPWESPSLSLRIAAGVAAVTIIGLALWFAIPRTSSPEAMATITLGISAVSRDEGAPIQKIPPPSGPLKIFLRLPEPASHGENYRVRLLSEDGGTNTFEVVERNAQTVAVVVPAKQLARGSYALKLLIIDGEGAERPVNGSYLFAVE